MGQEKGTRRRRRNRVPGIDGFFRKRKIANEFDFSDEENNYMKILKSKRNDFEKIESSNAKDGLFYCKICMEVKTMRDAFFVSDCYHACCSDCVAKYIRYKLNHKIINIRCLFPECRGSLEPEFCRSILPTDDFKRWNKAVCEILFNYTEKFYCPFTDCSALLINDGMEAVRNFECPNCNRMLCGQCKVRWHEGIECSEFKKLKWIDKGKDVMMENIAKDMRWRQCPKCRIYVAKSESRNIMICRCECRFCYKCGDVFSPGAGSCNCCKRISIYPYERPKHRRVSKENVSTNETLTIFLAQELNNILENYSTRFN